MADITMCSQVMCPKAGSCYRAQARPNPLQQSYKTFRYTISISGIDCEGYKPIPKNVVTDPTTGRAA